MSVYFNGEVLTIPGAYSAIDTSMMSTKNNVLGSETIAILGECTGGEPQCVQFFTEPTSARKILKSGELLKACEKAWNPVSQSKIGVSLGGANTIAVIRTNKATKSYYTLEKDVSEEQDGSDMQPQIVFQSKDWGAATDFQIKISDGALNGTKRIMIYDNNNEVAEKIDPVGNVFTFNYTGDQPYAVLNVYEDGAGTMFFETKVGADADTAQTDIKVVLDSSKMKSINALILELKSYENYQVGTQHQYNYRLKVTDLDFVKDADIVLPVDNTPYRVTAVYADIKYRLQTNSQCVEVESYDKKLGPVPNFDYVTLTGGSEGYSPASWVKFFDMLSNYDITYIVPLTSDESVHAELASHVVELSGSLGRERRGIVGGNNGETINETLLRAANLASDRMQIVHGGFYDIESGSELRLYPPYILAAQHAGRAAFLEGGETATHDVYRMSAPEWKLERTEITQLLNGGALAFEFVLGRNNTSQSYVRLVQDLTTDIISTDTVHTERATGALADSINKEMRDTMERMLTGKRTSQTDIVSAKNAIISILEERQRKGHIIAFKDVYVTKSGTVCEIEYSVAPAEPNNFTLITAHYYSETLTA